MARKSSTRSGVQHGVKRHDSTTTASEPAEKSPSLGTLANERRQDELVRSLPDSLDNAQERGERHDAAKAIATSGKSVASKEQ